MPPRTHHPESREDLSLPWIDGNRDSGHEEALSGEYNPFKTIVKPSAVLAKAVN